MIFHGTRPPRIGSGVRLGVLALSALTGCGPRATPAPSFAGANIDTVGQSSIHAYANSLDFDSMPPAPDTITVVDSMNVRARVLIAPEIGSISLTRAQLAQGRIIALIRSDATSSPLGLTAGRSYMWVDSGAMGWRAVTIPDTNGTRRVRALLYQPHPPPDPSRAEARLGTWPLRGDTAVHNPALLLAWPICGPHGGLQCCGDSGRARTVSPTELNSAIAEIHARMH